MKGKDLRDAGRAGFRDDEHRYPFIITENIQNIMRSVKSAVANNNWIYISGDVGTGKTEYFKYQTNEWHREPEKYVVLRMTAWLKPGSRVAVMMKWLIGNLDPDHRIPGDVELRAERLKTLLMRAYREKKRVILLIDEAQDLSEATFRELKKVHELSAFGVPHLFSIIMTAKESSRAEGFLAGRELGYRIKRVAIIPLDELEMAIFAEKRYGVTFPSGAQRKNILSYFCQMAHPSPLGVRHLCEAIQDWPGFDGTVTLEVMQGAMRRDRKQLRTKYRITGRDIQDEMKKRHNSNVSAGTVSDVLAGKSEKYNNKTVQQIQAIEEDLLRGARQEERAAM